MALPKEPRQQMITMMYLVLTAMLALNVSAEILKAFNIVNRSLEKTKDVIVDKNKLMYDQFEKKLSEDREKTKPFYDKAMIVKQTCSDLSEYIVKLKDRIIDMGGNANGKVDEPDFQDPETKQLAGEKNLDISSQVFIVEGAGKNGKEFRAKIEETRDKLLGIVDDPETRKLMEGTLPLSKPVDPPMKDGIQKNWQESLFGEIPLAASVTLLSKFEADVKTTEAELVNYLLSSISAADFKFDKLKAMVVTKSSYVMQGSDYEAEIFVSAYSSTQNPEVIIGKIDSMGNVSGDTIMVPVSNGIANYKIRTSGIGEKEYGGVIKIKQPSGDGYDYYEFDASYMVMQPQAVVSPTKMNVLYIGVENPLAISAAGVTADKLSASISNGTLRAGKKKGEYMARVGKPGEAVVSVSAKLEEGGSKRLGSQKFRVKRVPDPIAKIAGQSGGNIKTGTFKAQRGIMAVLENFDFEFKYSIQSFELTYAAKRQDLIMAKAKGPLFDSKMLGWIKRAKPGDMFYFDNIKAKGEDGTTRKLPSIAFKLL